MYLWNSTGTTAAGTGTAGSGANQLYEPFGLAIDSSNSLYIADWVNSRVQKYAVGATTGTTVAGQASGTSGTGLNYLSSCGGVAVDSSHTVYVADTGNSRGVSWANGASTGTLIAGTSGTAGSANNQLDYPYSITLDSTGSVYISDFYNSRVMKYVSGSTTGSMVAGSSTGAGCTTTQLFYPLGIYFETSSNSLIIANYYCNNVVRWVMGATSWTIVAGSASGTSGSTSTLLYYPVALAVDPSGNVYVTDSANSRVQLFLAGQLNGTTVAGTGGSGSAANQLSSPYGIALDSQLNLYVADTGNSRVQKFAHS